MPTLALTAVVDGTVTNPVPVEQNFYNPSAAGTGSAEIINGHLDDNNREAGWDIQREHIQERALSGGGTVGANTNLDYFGQMFQGWTPALDVTEPTLSWGKYKTIPGGAVEYYLPYGCSIVILSWSVFASSMVDLTVGNTDLVNRQSVQGLYNINTGGRIRLFVDGSPILPKYFDIPTMVGCTPGGNGTGTGDGIGNMAGTFDRWWTGHILLTGAPDRTKGWHRASLRIASTSLKALGEPHDETKHSQSRVRCRHMDYVYFL
jgi:hypothetical protein